jgi:hypothetical protein
MPEIVDGGERAELTVREASRILRRELNLPAPAAVSTAGELVEAFDEGAEITMDEFLLTASELVGGAAYGRPTRWTPPSTGAREPRFVVPEETALSGFSPALTPPQQTFVVSTGGVGYPAHPTLGGQYLPVLAGAVARVVATELAFDFGKFLLGQAWETAGGDESPVRGSGDEAVHDSGPSGAWFGDGKAPIFGRVTTSWDGCCADPDGLDITMTVQVSDVGGDFWENDTGVRRIELTAHRVRNRARGEFDHHQVDAHLDDQWDSPGEHETKEMALSGCVPCLFVDDDGTILVTIWAEDWNGNWRLKRQTLTVPESQLDCCW